MVEAHRERHASLPSKPSACRSEREATLPIVVQRLQQRLGTSSEVAALVAELACLGPQEARR